MAARLVRYQEGMQLGHGYDLLNGSSLPSPAVTGSISHIQDAGGQTVTKGFLRIDDQKTLHETIGVNVDAGGSYFGISGDVKVAYAKECNLSEFATHVMVHVSVEDAFESFDDPALSAEADDLLKVAGMSESERFKERFGDVFMNGLRRGGEYFATWEIVSTDSSVRDQIATHIEASFDDFLASAHLDVDIKETAATSSAHVEVLVHVFQAGSIDHTDQTMSEIMQKAHNFPTSVAGDLAVPFAVSLANYSALQLPNDHFDFLQIQNQVDVLAEHAQKRFSFLTQRNSLSYARQHPDQFIDADDVKLAAELAAITAAINRMEVEASACLRDANSCQFTAFDISDFPLPAPKPISGIVQDAWINKSSMSISRDSMGVASANNGLLYAMGGRAGAHAIASASVEAYDPVTNSWTVKAPMTTARYSFGLTSTDTGKLYAVGGFGEGGVTLSSVEEYDPESDSWRTMADLPTARGVLGLAAGQNGRLYAIGGSADGDTSLPTVEEFDPATNSWTTKKPMQKASSGFGLILAADGKLYRIGGSADYSPLAAVEAYDPLSDSWTTKAPILRAQFMAGRVAAHQDKIYAVCSISPQDNVFAIQEYVLEKDLWTTKAVMPTARVNLGLARAPNGRLYAVGGDQVGAATVTPLATVEEYTP